MSRRMLVAYSMSGTHVQTTADYLRALAEYTGYEVDYIHVTHDAEMGIDFDGYDIVFLNYCARLCFEGIVSKSFKEKMRTFDGLKVLAVQDEYDQTNLLKRAIKDLKFDIVLTCVPQDTLEYVYSRAEFPDVKFVTVLTGYVPEDFAKDRPPPKPLAERPTLIGYRGRDIGGLYGSLGFQKYEIGRRMKELCDQRGIETDIAFDEENRIYGTAWFDFIGNCRAMLGSESGSNVFDFDGSLRKKFAELTAQNQGRPPSYEEFYPYTRDREVHIDMGQISPRVFECALMRTPMVLFRGRYSDAIAPDEHYIPLERDFSNADEVLKRLFDLGALQVMADRAYVHLVESGKFGYRAYCQRLRNIFAEAIASRRVRAAGMPARRSSFPVLDRRSAIVTEFPSKEFGSIDEIHERIRRLATLNWEDHNLAMLEAHRQRRKRWRSTLLAHADIIREIARETGKMPISNRLAESLLEHCDSLDALDKGVSADYVSGIVRISQLDCFADNAEYLAIEDGIAANRDQLLEESADFETGSFWDLVRLNRQLLADIGELRLTVRWKVRLRWRCAATLALLKAPPRLAFVTMVQRFPMLHKTAKRARALLRVRAL